MSRYTNRRVAEIFNEIADLSEIKGEVIYRVMAYRKAADSIAHLGRDINQVWQAGKLRDIPGVGQAISDKIGELLSTGRMTFYDKLTAEVPLSLAEVLRIPDVGPKKARAMHNPHVDAIGHPSGRLLGQREESAVDLDEVLRVAAKTGTMIEINAAPERLDLDDVHVRRAVELGVLLIINTDAHHPDHFDNLLFGVATARRGWAGPEHIANTLPLEALLARRKGGA